MMSSIATAESSAVVRARLWSRPMSRSRARAASNGESNAAAESVDFGFRRVSADHKGRLVRAVFDSVAPRYDLMNDLMSAGLHRHWKNALVDWLNPRPGMRLLDIGGGTGDVARRFLARGARPIVCDVNASMLDVGRDRDIDGGELSAITWVNGDAENLPFADFSMDAWASAFCLRNVTDLPKALAEARRVLKPGGRFLCLEFSRVVIPILDRLYDSYSFRVVPLLGRWVADDEKAYLYLAESIRRFPAQEAFAAMIAEAGLGQVKCRNLSGGIAALHSAWRV
jgi:demethylmenaquinone methyltransferase/2-methoxy-6-polyprenyl-1,4-benzoquinol methylase